MQQDGESKMNNTKSMKCPDCGTDIQVSNEHLKYLICTFCGISIEIEEKKELNFLKNSSILKKGCQGCN